MTLAAGQILQTRYRIDALLGQGGMGAVYHAYDTILNRPCALKCLVVPASLNAVEATQMRQQFHHEAAVLANLSHPSLPRVTDYFSWNADDFLVMDFIEGESLEDLIQHQGALAEGRVLAWAGQLLDALAYCHSQGVFHRDVKPANIIITPHGRAVLVDFGLVKLWNPADPRTMTVMRGLGTPQYAPPEQYASGPGHTDARSDLYALGATLYHALAGQEPPIAPLRMASPGSFASPRVWNPALSAQTEAAVLKAMGLDRDMRFRSAEEMQAVLNRQAPLTRQAPPNQQTALNQQIILKKQTPRRRVTEPWLMAGMLALALLVGAWLFLGRSSDPGMGMPARTTAGPIGLSAPATPAALVPTVRPAPESTATSLLPVSSPVPASPLPPVQAHTPASPPTTIAISPEPPPAATPIVQGTSPLRLSSDPAQEYVPSYSPDGRYVVYMSDRDGSWQIYRMNADGSGARRLTTNDADNYHPRFSPDGRQIAFASRMDGDWDLYLMDLDGQLIRQVLDQPGDQYYPYFAPNGQRLSFMGKTDGKWEVFTIDVAGGYVQNVTNHPANDAYAAFAPDGRHLVFQSDRDGNWEIYILDLDSGLVQRLTDDKGRDADPIVSPDGRWIVFESNRNGNYDVYVMDWTGGQIQRLTTDPANDWVPAFAPDNSGIIFQSSRSGGMDLYVLPFRS
jgi:Tol biopolymer transport system component/predicted Ser/Thr protein kinase